MKIYIDEQPNERFLFKVNIKNECIQNIGFIYLVAMQTIFALQNGELLAKTPEIDFLMRIAKTNQIFKAKKRCSASDHTIFVVESGEPMTIEITENDLNEAEVSALVALGKS